MAPTRSKSAPVDAYIAGFPSEVQAVLRRIRDVVRAAAPEAEETISYRIPAYKGNGILVYFAAFKNHIGFYPPVAGDAKLMAAIAPYAGPKGNLQFPLDRPIPYRLIERITRLRVRQDAGKTGPPARKKAARGKTPAPPSGATKAWFAAAPAPQRPVLNALRGMILAAAPDVIEEFKWSRPCYSVPGGMFCYLHSTRNHATIGFHKGTSLQDPQRILRGTGKEMRHVRIASADAMDRAALAELIRQAAVLS